MTAIAVATANGYTAVVIERLNMAATCQQLKVSARCLEEMVARGDGADFPWPQVPAAAEPRPTPVVSPPRKTWASFSFWTQASMQVRIIDQAS